MQTGLYLLAGYAMVIRTSSTAEGLRSEVSAMKDQLKELANIIVTQARQDERLNNMSMRINRLDNTVEMLRKGAGWIKDPDAKSVDREYGG